MTSRVEITGKYANAYARAAKKDKGRILDEVVAVTGWSRDNARRRLTAAAAAAGRARPVGGRPRRPRAPKYSCDALRVLQKVWAASGGQCGKYLAASMRIQLDGWERHHELSFGRDRYSAEVRAELLHMSAATIDRYLKAAKAKDQISGVSTTKPSLCCCGIRSRCAELVMRSRPSRGSSKAIPWRTAGPRSRASSPAR